jgi:hypothetical protein
MQSLVLGAPEVLKPGRDSGDQTRGQPVPAVEHLPLEQDNGYPEAVDVDVGDESLELVGGRRGDQVGEGVGL